MTDGVRLLRFFLGANTPQGFVSRFDQLEREKDGWETHIIKGGPGSGKSTLMKRIARAAEGPGETVEEIYCSSDCGSLDGVIIHNRRFSVADGTPPHLLEPKCPGAYDSILNLCSCWNAEKLRARRGEIMALSRRISSLHAQSTRFLSAYAALAGENRMFALECTDTEKIREHAARLAAREMRRRSGHTPHEDIRFLSGITDRGIFVFEETARTLAERIYIIEDDCGAASRILLFELRRLALSRGYDIISCFCPVEPDEKLEHLFIPALSLGFMTSNRRHPLSLTPYRVLHARRFTDTEALRRHRQRLSFSRKMGAQMLEKSAACLKEAKALHDELEAHYIAAMDFAALDSFAEKTIRELLG
ncbi:MAG: hypothetical protein HFG27_12375 [Provencibacterium sp.]|jgi:hypothetical protein|nr:hypothetical protein [Provencibacterium sp.]